MVCRIRAGCLAALLCAAIVAAPLHAQQSRSAPLAADVAARLDARKLDGFAAQVGGNEWVSVLYLPGSQLLVVKGRYSGDDSLDALANQRAYRQLYIALNSAADPDTKVLISDLGANGLRAVRDGGQPADRVDQGGESFTFDGDATRARSAEYLDNYRKAEEQYIQMLQQLLAGLR